jgi:transposase
MDEAGIEQYIYREYAKSIKGQRVYGEISGKRYIRTSIISALNYENKLIAPFIFDGMTDTDLVLWWVKNILIRALPKNSIIIWDNASFHKSKSLKEILEEAGHTMIFLPAYSPDLNPIENKWHELKQRLRSFYDNSIDFIENLCIQINLISVNV